MEIISPEKTLKEKTPKKLTIIKVSKEEDNEPVIIPPIPEPEEIHCKSCGKLIHPSQLYLVDGWKSRPDGLNFLGAIPKNIYCLPCGDSDELKKLLKKEKKA